MFFLKLGIVLSHSGFCIGRTHAWLSTTDGLWRTSVSGNRPSRGDGELRSLVEAASLLHSFGCKHGQFMEEDVPYTGLDSSSWIAHQYLWQQKKFVEGRNFWSNHNASVLQWVIWHSLQQVSTTRNFILLIEGKWGEENLGRGHGLLTLRFPSLDVISICGISVQMMDWWRNIGLLHGKRSVKTLIKDDIFWNCKLILAYPGIFWISWNYKEWKRWSWHLMTIFSRVKQFRIGGGEGYRKLLVVATFDHLWL